MRSAVAKRGALEVPHIRLALMRELAAGEHPQTELARRHGVTSQAVSEFAARHAERIADIVGKLDDQFAGLWAADKAARVATYQGQIEQIADLLDDAAGAGTDDGERATSLLRALAESNTSTSELMRTQGAALRAIAEELGQLPARMQVQHSGSLEVKINGVDMAALT